MPNSEHIEGLKGNKVKTEEFIRALKSQIEGLQNLVRVSDRAIRRHLQTDAISQAWEDSRSEATTCHLLLIWHGCGAQYRTGSTSH
jgi:hypothetical protein